jgi:hypothetical protein
LWFSPQSENPLIPPLHLSVGEASGRNAARWNLEIVWSVFAHELQFGTSSRFAYRSTQQLERGASPAMGFMALTCGGRQLIRWQRQLKPLFFVERRIRRLMWTFIAVVWAIRIGAIVSTGLTRRPLSLALLFPLSPASCLLPISVTQPAVVEDNSIAATGEDLAVAFLLPSEYHGVLFQPEPRLKLLSLKAAFMDPLIEPVASSDPPRATLAKWWKEEVSKRIRDSYDKMRLPEELKAAMRGRARLYRGEVVDVVDLAAEAPIVDPAAEASDGGSSPAKRSRRSVSRLRVVATSSSSSGQDGPGIGINRGVLPRPRVVMGDGRGSGAAPGGAISASGSVGARGALSAEEVELFKSLLLRVLEKL